MRDPARCFRTLLWLLPGMYYLAKGWVWLAQLLGAGVADLYHWIF